MVQESRIAEILEGARTLDVGVRQLIKEANTEGGRDNITVVAFRLEGAEARAEAEDVTLVGPTAEEAGLTAETVGAATGGRRRRPGGYVPPRRSRTRRAGAVLAAIAVLAVIAGGAVYGARQIYFLGTDDGGRLALYRGLPYDLPAGVSLYSQQTSAPIQVASLPANRRDSVTDHKLRSHDDAVSLYDDLERSAAIPSGGGGGGKSGQGQGAGNGGGTGGGGSTQGGGGGSGRKGSQKQ
jgi:protein phosphatase